ncbi:hypothetical protein [Bacillus solitudinis]|uniref:hypothetical protein n=1 Tax=Bacillus solitudinis TaxID=2014074 RepID=UPI000C250F38|nr:hypothetical protein [Bacillus solitudinis]
MNHLSMFLLSTIEWVALLSFPIVLLGYLYRRYLKIILLIAVTMSILSILFRLTGLPISLIIFIQILLLFFFIYLLFKFNYLESLVFTSIGYGFYSLTQLLYIETVTTLSAYSYFDLFFSIPATIAQLITAASIFVLCYVIAKYDYNLLELRHYIKTKQSNKKIKMIIIVNSLLIFVFICLAMIALFSQGLDSKPSFVLACIVTLFVILSIYLILHTQFQQKRLIEAKKFYLDQEQQTAAIVEKLNADYTRHFLAINKLYERGSYPLIKEYIDLHTLSRSKPSFPGTSNLHANVTILDDLLYAFIINKRKLASLMGITIDVTAEITNKTPSTLQQIRYLSTIFDDLIFTLSQAPDTVDKHICFHVQVTDYKIIFDISSSLKLDERHNTHSKLFDALLQFRNNNAVVDIQLKPVKLLISCSLT